MLELQGFNVRFVAQGERYGLDDCLVHDKADPLVEFYLRDAKGYGPRGYFISRYYASTLLQGKPRGLLLEGSRPQWTVTDEEMAVVHTYIEQSMQDG